MTDTPPDVARETLAERVEIRDRVIRIQPFTLRREPTAADLSSSRFELIWQLVKHLDVDHGGELRSGATGNDVCAILDWLSPASSPVPSSEAPRFVACPRCGGPLQETNGHYVRTGEAVAIMVCANPACEFADTAAPQSVSADTREELLAKLGPMAPVAQELIQRMASVPSSEALAALLQEMWLASKLAQPIAQPQVFMWAKSLSAALASLQEPKGVPHAHE